MISKDRKPEAFEVLAALNDTTPDDDAIVAEASVIIDAVRRNAKVQAGFKDLFTGGKTAHFQRMLIGSSTQFFQQFTGCNAAIYYSTLLFYETVFHLINPTEQNAKGAAVGIYLFIVFFAFTILPLPWIYPPEINPLRTRTTASAVSTCTNWLTNFAVVMFTPPFISASGWGCYLYFAVMNFLFVPIIFFFYPETAGRSLEEIDIIFAKAYVEKRQPWRVR